MNKLPCKECIVFAICKQKEVVPCERLLEWSRMRDIEEQESILSFFEKREVKVATSHDGVVRTIYYVNPPRLKPE